MIRLPMISVLNRKSASRETVTNVYRGLLKRDPDEAGLNHFTEHLAAGKITTSQLIKYVLDSTEFKNSNLRPGTDSVLACHEADAVALFNSFKRYEGPGRNGFITNFLGCVTATDYVHAAQLSGVVESLPIPRNFHADTLEWVGTLQAVRDARKTFTMIELGAGWGPWCTIGYVASEMLSLVPSVIAVEGDPGHVRYIEQSFHDNGQDLSRCSVIHAVVGVADGQASFPTLRMASRDYGGAAIFNGKADQFSKHFLAHTSHNVEKLEEVACFSLATILEKVGRPCDLVHCDIQGAEGEVLPHHISALSSSVRRLIVGTHSHEVDRKLITLFPQHGWVCEGAEATRMVTNGGTSHVVHDGTQVWRNSRML